MNYLETIKNITKDKKRKNENLILLVVLLVIILISINYIFSDNKSNSTSDSKNIIDSSSSDTNSNNKQVSATQTLEKRLEEILSQISGISDVSVVLSYKNDSTQNVIYNTTEEEKDGEKKSQKQVAYNEENGKKTAIVESVQMPVVEGAIIVAKGASSVDIKSKIASAISSVTNLPVYKIQVFEKGE